MSRTLDEMRKDNAEVRHIFGHKDVQSVGPKVVVNGCDVIDDLLDRIAKAREIVSDAAQGAYDEAEAKKVLAIIDEGTNR